MTPLDYTILVGTLLTIALYGMWRTRVAGDLNSYLKGDHTIKWGTIGLSVMATQASAITFLSTPGQAYTSGMAFVQNYFGMPFALIIICIFFIPIYKRLKVYTAYEYLGQRFDRKTRYLGAFAFLLQRGLAAGITIYAPAIIVSTILGWNLDITIFLVGTLVIIYTVSGGTKAVSITQRYQMAIILIGMFVAFCMIIAKLPEDISWRQAVSVAGVMGKLEAVDFSLDFNKRYTFWSGILGGLFLSLSYFGTDQSQVQRYIAGTSTAESRLGLIFNAVVKIPMQFFILFVGVMVFVFYQFERPPIFFNQATLEMVANSEYANELESLESQYEQNLEAKEAAIRRLASSMESGQEGAIQIEREVLTSLEAGGLAIRDQLKSVIETMDADLETNDSDYVFITFILNYLPVGIVGLLIAVIFSAAMSSTASELNALGSTTTVDFYRQLKKGEADDAHYIRASRFFTTLWGVIAILFALFAKLVENLIEAVNILGSIFYGIILGIFVVAFFIRFVKGTAVFTAALISQTIVIVMYKTSDIGYLWYNPIGCAAVVLLSMGIQSLLPSSNKQTA